MPIECNTKSILPPKICCDSVNRWVSSSVLVASAGMICEPVLSANFFISPIRIAMGALVKTNRAPSSCAFSATFQAIEFSSSAPVMMPVFPFSNW